MINEVSFLSNLINPCKLDSSSRLQSFIQSESSDYNPSGEIRFNFPSSDVVDLTEAYLDLIVTLQNTTAPLDYVADLKWFGSHAPDSGAFRLTFGSQTSSSIAFNETAANIETIINEMVNISGEEYIASVAGTTFDANDIVITIPIGVRGPFGVDSDLAASNSSLANSTDATTVSPAIIVTQAATAGFPRLEFKNCLINQLRINIDSNEFVNISNCNVLNAMCSMLQPFTARYKKFQTMSENVHGLYSANQFRIRLELDHINAIKGLIYPLELMNGKQLRIYMKLEQPNYCLILESAVSTGTYKISNARIHYHKLILNSSQKDAIRAKINGSGLIIPFKSFTNYNFQLPSGSVSQDVLFNPAVKSLLAIFFVFQPNSYRGDPTNEDKLTIWLKNAIANYRLKVGSTYYPLDTIDSLSSHLDNVELIEYALDAFQIIYPEIALTRGTQQMFAGYTSGLGNDPTKRIYLDAFTTSVPQSTILAIATNNQPSNPHLCKHTALDGVDTSYLSNVVLELRDMILTESNQLQIFSYSQQYLIIQGDKVTWVK